MKLNRDLLAKAAGLERLDDRAFDRLQAYGGFLQEANQKINLISRSADLVTEIENQIAISLLPLQLIPRSVATWLDIGSGGGFPVIPLACLRHDISFTAVEQIAKKAYFIERTSQDIGLKNVRVEANSIERVIAAKRSTHWDAISIKAVTQLGTSMAWGDELLITGGALLTYKPSATEGDDTEHQRNHGFELVNSLDVKELIDTIDVRIVMYKKS